MFRTENDGQCIRLREDVNFNFAPIISKQLHILQYENFGTRVFMGFLYLLNRFTVIYSVTSGNPNTR
jgi:hypothetical protein